MRFAVFINARSLAQLSAGLVDEVCVAIEVELDVGMDVDAEEDKEEGEKTEVRRPLLGSHSARWSSVDWGGCEGMIWGGIERKVCVCVCVCVVGGGGEGVELRKR